ncbi:FAD binding domain-containing protein [Marinibaculum pumilum]|uniref:FAD binding domain-containing protein n=1 Tax=Marinibaculum pumilum TaxID=1766165 RepID=A0ABV7KVV0_9PROT
MKPAPFAYAVAADLDAALAQLAAGETAKPVAGNQSLGPMLNLRLARPGLLVDIARLPALRAVEEGADAVRYGAAITHAEIEDGEVPDATGGWLRAAAAGIAHRAVRNRGTLGGSLAHADPAADWAVVMTGLCATAIVEGPEGARRVAMEDFLTGAYATTLRPGELLAAVEVPRPGPGTQWGYWKFVRQVGEFAKASATVLVDRAHGRLRCTLGALGTAPLVLPQAEALLAGDCTPAEAVAAALPDRTKEGRALHEVALARALSQAGIDSAGGSGA